MYLCVVFFTESQETIHCTENPEDQEEEEE